MIEFGNVEHGRRIAAAIPTNYNEAIDPVISRTDGEKLLGGVIFYGYTGSAIFAHQVGFDRSWLNRDMLWVLFDYPFNQIGVQKIIGTIPSGNPSLLAFNVHLGFKVEAILKDAYPTGDMLIMSMTREDCRWLKLKPRGLQAGTLEGNSQ